MDGARMIDRLEAGGGMLGDVLGRVPEAESLLRPAEGAWCLREMAGHLLSEEREDFRARLDHVLHRTADPWAPLDPERVVREGGFRDRPLASLREEFLAERTRSVAWLRSLPAPDWARAKPHPLMGEFAAGDLLGAWVAHDLLHLRQAARILHAVAASGAAPFRTLYAGEW